MFPHRDPAPSDTWLTKWSPPVALSSLDIDRNFIAQDDVIVTNDKLAALLLLGKVDYWWPPDPESAERYSFVDQQGGQTRGVYGGAPVLTDSSQLRLLLDRHTRGVVVALFNTGKFGFDPLQLLQGLIDEKAMVELEERGERLVRRAISSPPLKRSEQIRHESHESGVDPHMQG